MNPPLADDRNGSRFARTINRNNKISIKISAKITFGTSKGEIVTGITNNGKKKSKKKTR